MLEEELKTIKEEGKLRKEQREQIKKRIEESKGGSKKKFRLGKACIEYIMPIWNKKYKYNQRPAYLIQLTEEYFAQNVKEEIVEKELEQYCTEDLEWIINGELEYACITRAAALICYESLSKENSSNSEIHYWINYYLKRSFNYLKVSINYLKGSSLLESEEELWDSAVLIGLVMEKEEEKEYWLWYIEKVKELLEEKEKEEAISTKTEIEICDLANKNNDKKSFLEDFPLNPPI